MNNKILFASIVSGLVVGGLAAEIESPTVSRSLKSETSIVIKSNEGLHLMDLNAGIKLKRSGKYEMYFLTDQKVGFNASGDYYFQRHGLSLMPETSEQVIPSKNDASVIDIMFSQRGMHSLEDLKLIPVSDKQMILVAPRYSYLFADTTE
ncbi:hypothetical protein VIOR3934_15771 [Vibrio orientalis CIP 102891 = ATCC 33934]|uniref:Uncharacterized protein n=2 Tax=Vibrio orientalis CIP 102891 = ATCC 33934 TaxID=675816 RepID=F9SW30_VIBOR|nr:hypothetical protein [Vibrio orientalis]EGU47996.1 hypothetical protein VIOR3934_15771 [Vibrio orientalis CIP 102891 = ATCC 33934]